MRRSANPVPGQPRPDRQNSVTVRTCVIFNPTARGDKAKRFRRHLDEIASHCSLKLTTAPGDARRLAAGAVHEGFDIVTAAGGDGTVHEVLNGLADAPDGLNRARLAVLPLGTVNVFARELGIPAALERAWDVVRRGHEARVDLPWADFQHNGSPQRRCFAQLGGAGLDARAIELVDWPLKKKIGPLAYVAAGLRALAENPSCITAAGGEASATGGLVLIGNGRLYGGSFRIFPRADLRDGLLDVRVFPRVSWLTLAHCGPQLLLRGTLPASAARSFHAATLTLTSPSRAPFELDGELVGQLPATFSVQREGLRVIVP